MVNEITTKALELSEGEKCITVDWPLAQSGSFCLAVAGHDGVKAVANTTLGETGLLIVEQMLAIDEASQKLWENFKKSFPDVADHFLSLKAEDGVKTDSLGYLLWVVSALLWLGEDDIHTAQTLAKVGLKVDTQLIKGEGVALLDTPRLLRSLISYKIAGVGNATLLFSLYESLADFVIDTTGMLNETFKSRVVVFSGEVANHPLVKDRIDHRMGRRSKLIWA